jgi:ABC-2 type transport system permease protein
VNTNASATTTTTTTSWRDDLRLVGAELRYEQLAFWRNPFSAAFTLGFSVVFLVLLGATGGSERVDFLGNIRTVTYYVPGFVAYGVMATCFNVLAITLVNRRETGLLKRLRLSPLPTSIFLAGFVANAFVVTAIQVVLLLAVGRVAYDVAFPADLGAVVLAVAVGVFAFTALGIAASTLVPNQDAAGPILSIVFFVLLFLSGLWFPLRPGSALARVSAWFPVRDLMIAMFSPYDPRRQTSPYAWRELGYLVLWGTGAVIVAARRFRWEPRRR